MSTKKLIVEVEVQNAPDVQKQMKGIEDSLKLIAKQNQELMRTSREAAGVIVDAYVNIKKQEDARAEALRKEVSSVRVSTNANKERTKSVLDQEKALKKQISASIRQERAMRSITRSVTGLVRSGTQLLRMYALMTAANEKDAQAMIKRIAQFEGLIQGILGVNEAYSNMLNIMNRIREVGVVGGVVRGVGGGVGGGVGTSVAGETVDIVGDVAGGYAGGAATARGGAFVRGLKNIGARAYAPIARVGLGTLGAAGAAAFGIGFAASRTSDFILDRPLDDPSLDPTARLPYGGFTPIGFAPGMGPTAAGMSNRVSPPPIIEQARSRVAAERDQRQRYAAFQNRAARFGRMSEAAGLTTSQRAALAGRRVADLQSAFDIGQQIDTTSMSFPEQIKLANEQLSLAGQLATELARTEQKKITDQLNNLSRVVELEREAYSTQTQRLSELNRQHMAEMGGAQRFLSLDPAERQQALRAGQRVMAGTATEEQLALARPLMVSEEGRTAVQRRTIELAGQAGYFDSSFVDPGSSMERALERLKEIGKLELSIDTSGEQIVKLEGQFQELSKNIGEKVADAVADKWEDAIQEIIADIDNINTKINN
tara:strand:+ start:15071 stop:16867 length:1797 start_codon:yes stop_codon:yes gene_type:complete